VTSPRSACEDSRSWDSVGGDTDDAGYDPRRSWGVCTREADCSGGLERRRAADRQLGTAHKELSAGVRSRVLESNGLSSEQVLAGFQTRRDGEIGVSAVDEEQIRAPLVGGSVVAILSDLEPLEACDGDLGSRRDLGKVCDNWAFVSGVKRIRRAGAKVSKRTIVELSRDRIASIYWDDSLGDGCGDASVADNVVGGQVGDGVVCGRNTNANAMALVDTVNGDRREDGLSSCGACEKDE